MKKNRIRIKWEVFMKKYPGIAQFMVFFIVCNGVTVLQMILMPMFKWIFSFTPLVNVDFQVLQVGHNLNGSPYFIFDYAGGAIENGGGGGIAYFLAVEFTMAIAQVVNFYTQRKVTFKSTGNIVKAAVWYIVAYIIITMGAAALQGIYKIPLYRTVMEIFGAKLGTVAADILTMLINCTISFWVFYAIMGWIFKTKKS